MTQLETLGLSAFAPVSEDGLLRLAALKNVKRLEFAGDAKDEGLRFLAGFDNLDTLEIGYGDRIYGAGLRHLPNPSRVAKS